MYEMPDSNRQPIDLAADVEAARDVLRPLVNRVRGLFQLWSIFTACSHMCSAFARDFATLGDEAKLAYTKAIVVDYAKPWSKNRSNALNSVMVNGDYPFLVPLVAGNVTHTALREMRDKMVAHIDEGYDGLGVTFRGFTIANVPPHRLRDEGTLADVFLPITIRVEAVRSIWWINDKKAVERVEAHVNHCIVLTRDALAQAATILRNTAFEHLHVLSKVTDIMALEELPADASGAHSERRVVASHMLPARVSVSPAISPQLGEESLQSLVSVFEPPPSLPANVKVRGKGYVLNIPEPDATDTVRWTVSFPPYPHPKGM